MNFDLRLPIGIMFSVFGLILTIFGAVSDKAIYQEHSLGININLIWGIVLLVFGLFMLFLALKGGKKSGPPQS
jgi:putative Mn2+ efflux pump MntP